MENPHAQYPLDRRLHTPLTWSAQYGENKISLLCEESNPDSSAVQTITQLLY